MKRRLVAITFLDHSYCPGNLAGPIECTAFGIFYKEDKQAYYIVPWIAGKEADSENTDVYCIVKHPGIKLKYL